jgi:hypothetical protein
VGHKFGQSNVCNQRRDEKHFRIEDKGISKVTILEIKGEVDFGTDRCKVLGHERTSGERKWEMQKQSKEWNNRRR